MTRVPEDLLSALGRVPIPAESAEQTATRRERVLQHLQRVEQRASERARSRGRRLRVAGVAIAFACGVGAALGLPRLHSALEPAARDVPLELVSGQIESGPQGLRPADSGFQMSVGQKLRAASARARVAVDRNATLDLATSTELSFAGVMGRRVVELHRGSVHLTVERLAAGQTLAVRTADVTVTVHGTRFSVTANARGAQTCTTVVLEQGVVSVDGKGRHALLTAPSTWSSCPVSPRPVNAQDAPRASEAERRPERATPEREATLPRSTRASSGTGHQVTPEATSRPPASSTLGEENLLLASARKAALGGDDAGAVAQLERLLELYPRSILAQNASVERFRALERLGRHGHARRAAARYLSDYPDGFAKDEARALVSRAP